MAAAKKPGIGGARKGAGRKAVVQGDDVRSVLVRIAALDRAFLLALGDGVLSRGVQIATQMAREQITQPSRPERRRARPGPSDGEN